MAANSKHFRDVEAWIYKVIDSCVTVRQVLGAQRLTSFYRNKYPSIEGCDEREVTNTCLRNYAYNKLSQIIDNEHI